MKNRTIYIPNIPLTAARQAWQQALAANGWFDAPNQLLAVDDSLGRITAEAVSARRSSPAHNAAAMDGVAVNCTDLAAASDAQPAVLGPGRFFPVNTGNAIPQGCNAVVMIEDVHYRSEQEIELRQPATPWQHIRTIGEDIVATELIIPEGHTIRPIDQGAMLAAGVTEILVRRPPTAIVIPTGSELIEPGVEPQLGSVVEFNSRILAGYLHQWGAVVSRHQPVADDLDALRTAIAAAAASHDLVVLNAGASAGSKDFSSTVLAELGQVIVHGVAIKPGKPVLLGLIGTTPVIGLPGYPVSAILTLRLFGRDMLARRSGHPAEDFGHLEATLARPLSSAMGVDEFFRITLGQVGDKLMASPAGKGAGAVMSLVRADGLLTVPAGSEGIGAGQQVTVELLRPQREVDATLVCIGSHDNLLDLLANQLYQQRPLVRLSSAHVGSMGGIMAIRRGEAHLAGCHLLDPATQEYTVPFLRRYLQGVPLVLINLCYRQQGLIVGAGNPKQIHTFHDLAAGGHSFINRQGGSGTRLLTDKVLAEQGIAAHQLSGYNHEEYTHMNVAAAVASGDADAGMGIRAAAVALGLDFVPIAEERYDLIVPSRFLDDPKMAALLAIIRDDPRFRARAQALGGYDLRHCGDIMYQQE